jgi:hypothetical protein
MVAELDNATILDNTSIEEQYREEIERGRQLYRETVLPQLKADGRANRGDMVVIDIHSGEFEIDSDDSAASFRLFARCPDAFTWTERIGYKVPHAIGGGMVLDDAF